MYNIICNNTVLKCYDTYNQIFTYKIPLRIIRTILNIFVTVLTKFKLSKIFFQEKEKKKKNKYFLLLFMRVC